MSEENSTSDIPTETTEESKPTEQQVHHVLNKITHDEDDTSEENSVAEIRPHTMNGEQNNLRENKFLTTNFGVKIKNQKLKCS